MTRPYLLTLLRTQKKNKVLPLSSLPPRVYHFNNQQEEEDMLRPTMSELLTLKNADHWHDNRPSEKDQIVSFALHKYLIEGLGTSYTYNGTLVPAWLYTILSRMQVNEKCDYCNGMCGFPIISHSLSHDDRLLYNIETIKDILGNYKGNCAQRRQNTIKELDKFDPDSFDAFMDGYMFNIICVGPCNGYLSKTNCTWCQDIKAPCDNMYCHKYMGDLNQIQSAFIRRRVEFRELVAEFAGNHEEKIDRITKKLRQTSAHIEKANSFIDKIYK